MYKLVSQKLVVLNTSAAGWATPERNVWSVSGLPLPAAGHSQRLSPGLAAQHQQGHSCAGLAVTWLQGCAAQEALAAFSQSPPGVTPRPTGRGCCEEQLLAGKM